MRFALSTLGCPELSLHEAADLARGHGYDALELRSTPGATVETRSSIAQRRQWRRQLDHVGIQALSIASYVMVCDAQADDATVVNAALAQLRLAHDLGAPMVRVFAGGVRGGAPDPESDQLGGRRLAAIVSATETLGVRLAVETHDSHPTGRDVVRLINGAQGADVAVIWDVLHTWLGEESPQDTVGTIAERLAYTQVKDVASRDDLSPLPLGQGVLPLTRCLDILRGADPSAWVSWEYERAWHPEAPTLAMLAGRARQWLDHPHPTAAS